MESNIIPTWRLVDIEAHNCSLLYLNFFPYGKANDEKFWRPIVLASAQQLQPNCPLDIQTLDRSDILLDEYPNRVLVNFRQAQESIVSFKLTLKVRDLESGNFMQFRTGSMPTSARIKVTAYTQQGQVIVVDTHINEKTRAVPISW